MIKVAIKRNQAGSIREFEVSGHASYAEAGSDIICSAVSVTAYTAAGALEELAGQRRCYREKDGHMVIRLPDKMTEEQEATARVILETTAIGFRQIELSYGEYVLVVEEEV
jgi:uncharacterized protein YsxB (DUF464 family)